jgi:hypothetical protein
VRRLSFYHAIIEPTTGYTDYEITLILWVWGAYNIEQLTPGFIEVYIDEYYLPTLKKIAKVHIKPTLMTHPAYKKRLLQMTDLIK